MLEMNDPRDRSDDVSTKAEGELRRLNGQVEAMRAVLVQLLQDVVRADSRMDQRQAAQLLEANEQLVFSALGAQSDAQTARGELDEAYRVSGLDPLTGLPNRRRLLDRFESAIFNAKRHGNRVALLFLDLDEFKEINDRFGHATGDLALRWVADCLVSFVRETDTVSRHGGDEFLILLSEVAHEADAVLVAEKVNSLLSTCGQIDGHEVNLTASIGISVYPEDGEHAEVLIDRADAGMYLAKGRQSGGFVSHDRNQVGQATFPIATDQSPPRRLTQYESAIAEHDRRHEQLREANEKLVLAALGAQELLAAAEDARRRQSELIEMVANELSDPFAPIRIAAATLGIAEAEATLLPRIQAVIDEQADKMLRMLRDVLQLHGPANDPMA